MCRHELTEPGEDCKYWKLGKCHTCAYINDNDDEWYKRGCEAWCFGGCIKYHRDWKKTFEYIRTKLGMKG